MKCFAIRALASLALIGGLFLPTRSALADTVTLTLPNFFQDTIPGGNLSFYATVSAPLTNTATENLNGDSFVIDSNLTLDDTSYLNTFPLSLNPGDSYTGLLFTVDVPYSAPLGIYTGTFSITGGSGIFSADTLSTANFDVNVTPEPPAFILFATGISALALAGFFRKRTAFSQV